MIKFLGIKRGRIQFEISPRELGMLRDALRAYTVGTIPAKPSRQDIDHFKKYRSFLAALDGAWERFEETITLEKEG